MNTDRLVLDASHAGQTLSAVLRRWRDVPWSTAKEWCTRGKVTLNGTIERDPAARPGSGVVVELHLGARPADAAAPDATGSSGDWLNEIHPNAAGWEKLAGGWQKAIKQGLT